MVAAGRRSPRPKAAWQRRPRTAPLRSLIPVKARFLVKSSWCPRQALLPRLSTPVEFWLWHNFRDRLASCWREDAFAEQVELRAAEHLLFDHFDAVDGSSTGPELQC
jgi:hypothetical protein